MIVYMPSLGVLALTGRERRRAEWGAARQAFLVLAGEIFAELEREEPGSKVYEKFRDRLGMSYSQFCYWVRRYRQRAAEGAKGSRNGDPASQRVPLPASPSVHPTEGGKFRDFHFDPLDAYRIKFD